jgi:predicted glutamate--cysteine ligase
LVLRQVRIRKLVFIQRKEMLLKKGFEIEQYTGLPNGQILPLSALISQSLKGFTIEPDQRNVEYITPALESYDELLCHLISGRMQLREFLRSQNTEWTIVPSSSLAMPFEKEFIMSKPEDEYHQHIRSRHGLSVITTSIHYNLGIEDKEELIRLVNLIRTEASLLLALAANSPFYDGKVTGNQSHRWATFPKVPDYIPFFDSHAHFISWTERMIEEKQMFNVRHFWGAVRPNGINRPTDVNRLEVRIADISTDWNLILGLMAWLELRVKYFMDRPDLKLSSHEDTFLQMADDNEMNAAIQGLGGHFSDWLYEEETSHFAAVQRRLDDMRDDAESLGIESQLASIEKVLTEGNESSQKLEKFNDGYSIPEIMEEWVQESLEHDLKTEEKCKEIDWVN